MHSLASFTTPVVALNSSREIQEEGFIQNRTHEARFLTRRRKRRRKRSVEFILK
jgi:hypothetical protein